MNIFTAFRALVLVAALAAIGCDRAVPPGGPVIHDPAGGPTAAPTAPPPADPATGTR